MDNPDITPIDGYGSRKLEDLYKNHSPLEANIKATLEKMGFLVEAAPYHRVMPPEAQKALHRDFAMTGEYIRARADRVILHKESGFSCQIEFKSSRYSRNDSTIFLQIMPLALHIYNSRIGIRTLYVYANSSDNSIAYFWANDSLIDAIQEIRIPPKKGVNRELQGMRLRQILGEKPKIRKTDSSSGRGSGDAYAVLDLNAIDVHTDLESVLKDAMFFHNLYSPDNPTKCANCKKTIDATKSRPCPDCGEMVMAAVFSSNCRCVFCSEECFNAMAMKHQNHEPEKIPLVMECSCGHQQLQDVRTDPNGIGLKDLMELHLRIYNDHQCRLRDATPEDLAKLVVPKRTESDDDYW